VQEATTSAWLTMSGCCRGLPERSTKRLQRVRRDQVDMTMSISVLCVEMTKPEPTMSHGRVLHLRLFKKMHILKHKLQNLRLNTHIHVTASRQNTR